MILLIATTDIMYLVQDDNLDEREKGMTRREIHRGRLLVLLLLVGLVE